MSSRGSQERGSGGRKSAAKRRHLSCRQCDILLPDDFEFTRCQDCRGSHVWLMSSRGSEERSAGGRKSTAKRRHLSCGDCDTPLPDDYEYSKCQECRAPEFDEPSIQDVVIWEYVQSSLKEIRESLVPSQKPAKFPQLRTALSSGEEFCILDELESASSETEDSTRKSHFSLEKMQRFLKSIREDVDKGEAPASTS